MANYLFGSTAKYFRNRQKRKKELKQKRQKDFRKGFVHKSSEPKHFDVEPTLPKYGNSKRKTIRRRIRSKL